MKEINISPPVQLLALLTVVGAIALVIAGELPEIRRYLSIRSM